MRKLTLEDSLLREGTVSFAVVTDCPWRPCPLALKTQRNIPVLFTKVVIFRSSLLLALLIYWEDKPLYLLICYVIEFIIMTYNVFYSLVPGLKIQKP